ncbi:MAG: dihydrolipoyl dehydrogenase [Thiohalomonadaceae bacterium]
MVLIEGGQYGTSCARVGCMPSKLLIAAADNANQMSLGELFGISPGGITVDGKRVMARVRSERDRFVAATVRSVEKYPESHRIQGHARFAAPDRLVVGNEIEIQAQRIIIATGSRPNIPDFLRAAKDRLIVSDDVFAWQDLPESIVVFGPGVIGLELGQALSRLGVRIRMFGIGGAVGPIQDNSIREYALRCFNEEFPLDPDSDVKRIERVSDGVAVTFTDGNAGEKTEIFEYLLAATGRSSNVDSLDIHNAEIELDKTGVPVFDPHTLRCGQSHIFIAGDANNSLPLLHEAADEGRIADNNAASYPDVRTGLRQTPLAIVFTDPQIATVGLTIEQVDKRCQGRFTVGEVSFENKGRSRIIAKNSGLLRLYGEHGSGLLMGAEMFAPGRRAHCSPARLFSTAAADGQRNTRDAVLPPGY